MSCVAYLTPSALDDYVFPLDSEDDDPSLAPFEGHPLVELWDVQLSNGEV